VKEEATCDGKSIFKRDLDGVHFQKSDGSRTGFPLDWRQAALAAIQLKHIEEFIERRRDIASVYTRSLAKGRHRTFSQDGESENVFYTFPVVFDGGVKEVVRYARNKRIVVEKAFQQVPAFLSAPEGSICPNAHALYLRCVFFPLYPLLGSEQIEQVARVLSTLP
jgi:dTDP-4-amino-4,6-dideoxygalactose transaminase